MNYSKDPKLIIVRFNEFISVLEGKFNQNKSLIPEEQLSKIRKIKFDPAAHFNIQPSEIFINSFDGWLVSLPIIPGEAYGPFYRVDGEKLELKDSDGKSPSSEEAYYYILQRPENQKEAVKLTNMRQKTPKTHIHRINFDKETTSKFSNAEIFLGPIRDTTGYQFNANKMAAALIRSLIARDMVITENLPE